MTYVPTKPASLKRRERVLRGCKPLVLPQNARCEVCGSILELGKGRAPDGVELVLCSECIYAVPLDWSGVNHRGLRIPPSLGPGRSVSG